MMIRQAEMRDIPTLAEMRRRQLIDEGLEPRGDIMPALLDFFERKLGDGSLTQWVAVEDDGIVATGALMYMEFPPNFKNHHCVGAYITNMYTLPQYRRKGLATAILKVLEREARAAGASRLWLGASDTGRPVYEKYGFVHEQRQMKIELDGEYD